MTEPDVMTFTIDSRIVDFFRGLAVIAAFLSAYVMQKTEHDKINEVASPRVKLFRRAGLCLTSAICIIAAVSFSIGILILAFLMGTINLAVNAVALRQRQPPNSEDGITSHVSGGIAPHTKLRPVNSRRR